MWQGMFSKKQTKWPWNQFYISSFGGIYTGCTTSYIDTTNTLTHRPIQVVLCLAGLYYVLTLCCNYHAAVTGSKSFATNSNFTTEMYFLVWLGSEIQNSSKRNGQSHFCWKYAFSKISWNHCRIIYNWLGQLTKTPLMPAPNY